MYGKQFRAGLFGLAIGLIASVPASAAPGPDIQTTKTCTLGANQSVTCTITIKNIGNVPSVAPLHVTDTVSPVAPGTIYVGAGGTLPFGCGPAGLYTSVGPVQCNANVSLAPSQSGTLIVAFKLPQGGVLYNCATASQGQNPGTPGDPNLANNTSCTKIQVAGGGGQPDIQTVKTCQVGANQSVTCAIVITNVGTAPSQAPLTVTDSPTSSPAGVICTGAGGPFSCGPAGVVPVHCSSNISLAPTQSVTLLLSFKLPPGGVVANCATANAAQVPGVPGDANPNNNTSCTKIQVAGGGKPDLSVVKGCTADPQHPHTLICNITVANLNGTAPSHAPFTLVDQMSGQPAGTVYNGPVAGGTTVSCSPGPGLYGPPIVCTGNYSLLPGNVSGGSASVILSFTGKPGTKFKNCVKVSDGPGAPAETNFANNSYCTVVAFP